MQITRFLRNPSVTAEEMAAYAAQQTASRAAGRDVVVIQDTSDLSLGGRRAKAQGYGIIGKGGAARGLLLHPALVVDATGAVLGLADIRVRNRSGGQAGSRRKRKISEKESQRWLDGTTRAAEALAQANSITGVSDRESDIYEHFAACPPNMHLIVRSCQDRLIATNGADQKNRLYAHVDGQPEQGQIEVEIPRAPGRAARKARLAFRFGHIELRKPQNGARRDLPPTIPLTMVDVRETSDPGAGQPVHWRLLTTHEVTSIDEACRIIELYRMRWIIEEFFRTLKTAGFDIESADIGNPEVMIKFVTAVTIAGVTVMQLVKARDGTTGRPLSDAFDPSDKPILDAVSAQLEGNTARQKNPHPKGSLAFTAWVMGRLGGWTGYYGKPGPQVMRRGLEAFQRIKLGFQLGMRNA